MTPRERVRRAIRFRSPDAIPILFFNKNREESDIILIDVVRHFTGPNKDRSEWGFEWERRDETMGQPKQALLRTWDDLERLEVPDPYDETRFAQVNEMRDRYGSDRYYVASLVLTGFTVMSALRGFTSALEDLCSDPDHMNLLADRVFEFEDRVIGCAADEGFDGVSFYDDWGTQNGLIISPGQWRAFFKPRYQRQFDYAHARGLDVYFHSCGNIEEIIPDLIEIGVDMLNLSQPNLYDLEALGARLRGRVCFVCPISYQTTAITGTRDDIFREAERLVANLAEADGGFIGYVEEYHSIGMSAENYGSCIDAFRTVKPLHRGEAW
jgi:uroporphyrinogen decarboxylase